MSGWEPCISLRAPRLLRTDRGATEETLVADGGISDEPIPARLGWQPTDRGLRLARQLVIDDFSDSHLWNATVDARAILTSMEDVKKRRRGTRISSKHQITIPVEALRASGLEVGQRLVAKAAGPGRVILEREDDVIGEFAGALTGVYEPGELDRLRDEWA